LALLSDAEVARVADAEDASTLVDGNEYVDLTDLANGRSARAIHAAYAAR
jgi:hypothetical protein